MKMAKNIKSIFDEACAHIKTDQKFIKRIHQFGMAFVNKNEDHVKFFGGNLTGVYPVRFKTSDAYEWYDDVLQINDSEVKSQIVSLPTINEDWVRGTDVMNLSCLWLSHRFANEKSLTPKAKEQGMIDSLMILHFKLITSLMAHYFKYPVDESVAIATYAALSKKYAIKQHGSWYKVLMNRCEDIISRNSIHRKTIEQFNDDAAIQYMITDVQGRLRAMVKNLANVMYQVRAQDARILSAGSMYEMDGKQVVKDMARNYTPYKRYLHEITPDKSRFIKPELLEIISSAMHTMPPKLLVQSLEYCSDYYGKDKNIEQLLDETLLHAFDYLHHDESAFARSNDIGTLITKLRAMYMSSRSTDPTLLKMRKLGEDIVKRATKNRNQSTISSVRTGIFLYIVTRTFSMKHYG